MVVLFFWLQPLPIHHIGVLAPFYVLNEKPSEIIFHPSDESKIPTEHSISCNTFFLNLPAYHCNIPHFHYRLFFVLHSASSCMLLEFAKAIKLCSSWNSNSNPFHYFSNQVNKCMCGNFKSNHAIRSI
jgi:hypothetical protein